MTFALAVLALVVLAAWMLGSAEAGAAIPINEPLPRSGVLSLDIPVERIVCNDDKCTPSTAEFTIVSSEPGKIMIVDMDGDKFICPTQPKNFSDMESCQRG